MNAQAPERAVFAEIQEQFGFVPPFFLAALGNPHVLKNLWEQTKSAYTGSPLDKLFLERLFAYLSKFCSAPYCLVCHSCYLRPLGMNGKDVLQLLERPIPSRETVQQFLNDGLKHAGNVGKWPTPGTHADDILIWLSVAAYLNLPDAAAAFIVLRRMLGDRDYQHLMAFLAYVKTCGVWIESHPELSYEADKRVIDYMGPTVEEEPRLLEFFAKYKTRVAEEKSRSGL
jgi:two-component system cell cycle sensor histidine kinase/response regulator CckA